MRANNPSFKVNKVSHSHKLPTKFVSTVPKFHSEAINPNNNANNVNVNVNVNRFSLFPPSQSPYKISPAKLHIFTPKDEFDKNFQEKKEQANSIDQTNLQGKRSSEPPSGHSYGSSKKSYGDYAADDEAPSKSASSSSSSSSSSGYQTSGVGYGGTNKDPRATAETSNAGGVSGGVGRSDGGGASGAAGSPSSSASSSGLGGASTGKQTGSETKWPPQGTTHSQSSWPPPSQATSGDPWIQSGHSTGTDWSPEKTAEKTGKDKEGKHAQDKSSSEHTSRRSKSEGKATDHKDSKLTDSINDPLQQSYSDTSFPEVTTKESMDSSTQRTAEDMISLKRARGEKDIKEGGVESQYNQRQFNNAFEDLSKVSPGSTEGVIDSARKALDTINSPSGLFSGMNQSDRDKDKWQEKSNTDSSTQRAKGEKDINEVDQHQFNNTFENLAKTAPEPTDVVRDAARKALDTINSQSSGLYAGMNQSDRDKDKWQEKSYNTLPKEGVKNKDTGIDLKGDKGQTSTSASADQSLGHKEGKEYENQVKGLEHKDETFYADNLGKKSTIKGDPYSALDTSSKDYEHRVKGTNYRDIEDSTVETVKKDTYDAMGKAKDTYNQVEGSVKGAFNQAKDTFNQAEGTIADKAKNAYNQVEGTVKGAYDTVVDKAKNIYENVSEKTTGMKDDLERKARDVVYDNVKQQAYNTVTDKARDTYNQVEGTYNQAKDAFNQAEGTVADKAKSAYNQVEGQVKGAFNQAKDTANEFINDVTAGQRTVTNERGEQRVVTGDDVKQDRGSSQRMDEGQGMNIQSVASNIVHKVIETAENVKEKVGNILHGVTGTTTDNTTNERDATRRDTEREGVSGRGTTYSRPDPNDFSNRPASEASGAKDENMYEKDREQKKRTDSQRHHHPDQDNNVGHASS